MLANLQYLNFGFGIKTKVSTVKLGDKELFGHPVVVP